MPSRHRILIISEYVPKGNLRSYISDDRLAFPWNLRLSFCVDVTRAIAYLHARKCMHRDLKGENLLITENDRIKVSSPQVSLSSQLSGLFDRFVISDLPGLLLEMRMR